jgi:hypothetical protein
VSFPHSISRRKAPPVTHPPSLQFLKKCLSDFIVIFSQRVYYNISTPVVATNLSNVAIQAKGNLHLPQNISYIQAIANASNALTHSTSLY